MKMRLFLQRSIVPVLLVFMYALVFSGCTDTTGSAGAVAVFDGNSRCRYCNERITNADIDTLSSKHGNGICAPEIDFVDSSTHLCVYCGKPYVYNAQSSHGKGVCVYLCAGATGHRVPAAGDHSECEICGGWLCVSEHGEGICGTLEPTPVPTPEPTPTLTPTPIPTSTPIPTPTPEPKSSNKTLRVFKATFPDGTVMDMSRVEARKNIVVTAQDSVTVTAIASDAKASVSGDKGTLALSLGANSFRVTVTAEDGTKANFNFTITVQEPSPTSESAPTPTPESVHTHSYDGYGYDEELHWRVCVSAGCGYSTPLQSHSLDQELGVCNACECGYKRHAHIVTDSDSEGHTYSCICGEDSFVAEHYYFSGSDTCWICGYESPQT